MRTVFIVNPAAGKRKRAMERIPEIHAYFAAHPEAGEYRIRVTRAPGDATAIARREAEEGGEVRLVACGGDGTLMETAEGMWDAPGASLACLPCGSANDYIRSFPEQGRFFSLPDLMAGETRRVDMIRCGDRVALNLCSMGMDAEVADRKDQFKSLPLVSGPMAYQMAIAYVFCHRIGRNLQVELDTAEGTVRRDGRYFFALAANGQYYGGGYRGAPEARPDDGLLDFVLVRAIPRLRVPGFLSRYKRGEHLDMTICESFRGREMRVSCDETAAVNLDGECFTAQETAFRVLPGALRFVVPGQG